MFFVVQFVLFLLIPGFAADGTVGDLRGQPVRRLHDVRRRLRHHSRRSWRTSSAADNVGAIHGALLTAWSAAAVAGPVIITELSNRAKAALAPGAERVHIYDTPLQVLAALLAVGFVLTLLVKPLSHSADTAPVSAREGVKAG